MFVAIPFPLDEILESSPVPTTVEGFIGDLLGCEQVFQGHAMGRD